MIDNDAVAVNSVLVDGPAGTVTLVLDEAVQPGELVEFTYTDPSGDNDTYAIQGPDGADTASIA
jgi:hypothetical protein